MKNIVVSFALALIAMTVATPARAQYGQSSYGYGDGQSFTCESNDGGYRECIVPNGAQVQMVRQLSRSPCEEGYSWGRSRGGVWVDRGCRAEFVVTPGYGRDAYGSYGNRYGRDRYPQYGNDRYSTPRVLCESPRGNHNECPMDTRRGVVLVRQLSDTRCREGHNWGTRDGVVWVDHGCRGEFAPGNGYGGGNYPVYNGYPNDPYENGYGSYNGAQIIECASYDGRQQYCQAPIRRGVEITRQISRSACVEGQTWGWDRRGVWVSNGCRAQFRVW